MKNQNYSMNQEKFDALALVIESVLFTIDNITYEEFNIKKEKLKRAFLSSFNYAVINYVNEVFEYLQDNKKLEKQKQKNSIAIFLDVMEKWEKQYLTGFEKFGKDN